MQNPSSDLDVSQSSSKESPKKSLKFFKILLVITILVLGYLVFDRNPRYSCKILGLRCSVYYSKPEEVVEQPQSPNYSCITGYLDCMPTVVDPSKGVYQQVLPNVCGNDDYLQWLEANCPEYEGVVY